MADKANYTVTFDPAYTEIERQNGTQYVEDVFSTFPSIAENIRLAAELKDKPVEIIFRPGNGRASATYETNQIHLDLHGGTSVFDPEQGCAVRRPLAVTLGHETNHLIIDMPGSREEIKRLDDLWNQSENELRAMRNAGITPDPEKLEAHERLFEQLRKAEDTREHFLEFENATKFEDQIAAEYDGVRVPPRRDYTNMYRNTGDTNQVEMAGTFGDGHRNLFHEDAYDYPQTAGLCTPENQPGLYELPSRPDSGSDAAPSESAVQAQEPATQPPVAPVSRPTASPKL